MSRDAYGGGSRSPRGVRLPTVDRSPSRVAYHPSATGGGGGSPVGRKPTRQSRSGNNSPTDHSYGYHHSSPYYRDDDLGSPMLLEEGRGRPITVGPPHHRSRSATRTSNPMSVRYQSLDRGPTMDHEREFLPIRDRRDRSLDRGLYYDDDPYSSRSARQSPTSHQPFIGELQNQNSDLQRDLANLKKELELTNQKLGSSMHSIKTFWSPELKKERALRKEESAKYSLINDQLKLLSSENQKQAMLVRQLEEELRMRVRGPSIEIQQQMEALYQENEHLQREIAILRDTIKELELRIETQKQTLQARDESIKKLLEMLQNKGMGKEEERQMFQQMQAMAQKQLDEFRVEIQRRDQEILAMGAKMKTLEEQHQDYQRHIAVLKESLCAKEEHYNMLQADCEELRARLEEKNRLIEKKQQQFQQERGRAAAEIAELREHMDIKDRKINVLQRKSELSISLDKETSEGLQLSSTIIEEEPFG
nr:unnamed protein product [Callosobruchus chinensis]